MAIKERWDRLTVDAAAVDSIAANDRTLVVGVPVGVTRKGRVRKRYELRVRRHGTAKRISGGLSLLIVLVSVRWYLTAAEWRNPCGDADPRVSCEQPDSWFRVSQFSLAMVGMITGAAVALYLARFAVTGRIWRRSRGVSLLHGAIVLTWLVVWAIGAVAR